jgi:hypothetical protein
LYLLRSARDPAAAAGRSLLLADYTEAISLDPKLAAAFYDAKGETDRAIADFTDATCHSRRRCEQGKAHEFVP